MGKLGMRPGAHRLGAPHGSTARMHQQAPEDEQHEEEPDPKPAPLVSARDSTRDRYQFTQLQHTHLLRF